MTLVLVVPPCITPFTLYLIPHCSLFNPPILLSPSTALCSIFPSLGDPLLPQGLLLGF